MAAEKKDYEQVYRACQILDAHQEEDSHWNLHPDHDTLYLCFDGVLEEDLSAEELAELEELGVRKGSDGQWYKHVSC
tara:strand:- start:1584 stop:1814 length:231 start_codon:yes stop_codon:yes gene_type:complete